MDINHSYHLAREIGTNNSLSVVSDFFSQSGFMPHGHCYLWQPSLVAAHVISDGLIGASYLVISVVLYALIRKIKIRFSSVALCFGLFIGACGITHWMEIWTLWHPDYWASAGVKIVTALASVGTAFYFYRLRKPIAEVAQASRLAEERRLELETLNQDLERRVLERTAALTARTTELETLFSHAPIGLAFVDKDYRYVRINKTLADMNGVSVFDHIGNTINDIVPVKSVAMETAIQQVFATGEATQTEIRGETPKEPGVEKCWLAGFYPVKTEDDYLHMVGCYMIEVTEQRRAENERRQYANTLLSVLNAASESVWLFDVSGKIQLANKTAASRLGYSVEELIGKSMHDLFLPALAEARMHRAQEVIRTKAEVQFEDERSGLYFAHIFTPVLDGAGEVSEIVAFSRDVTERQKSIAAIEESERRFRALANFIPQLTWITDPTGYVTWYNQRWYDFTGATVEQMRGWGWDAAQHPDHEHRVKAKWKRHLSTGEFWEDTFPLRSREGDYRWFLSRAFPLRGENGSILCWFGTNTDITEQLWIERELKESKEQAERANLAKSQFLANMSHEIRTPIGAIIGFGELLRNTQISEIERANFMDIIQRNSQHLLRLIDDILDLSKVEAGKLVVENLEFSLRDLVSEIVTVMELRAIEKKIQFKVVVDESVPNRIATDQIRLKQILINMIGNAIKFTSHGHIELRVFYREPILEFHIQDTGLGLTQEQQQALFRPFQQADPSMTRKFGGTGLGLVLSQRLAQALGGNVQLRWSRPGVGSNFVVTIWPEVLDGLSFLDDSRKTPVLFARKDSLSRESHAFVGKKIVLVEDSHDNQTLILTLLQSAGAEVLTAEDGQAGVDLILRTAPDLVFMDIQMPVMDGHQATQQLRKRGFKNPIIALTAHAMRDERERCFQSGCTDFLTKPVNREDLFKTLIRYKSPC